MSTIAARTDSFIRDRLPPRGTWPDLRFDHAGLSYPPRLNAAAELVDAWIARGHGDRPCIIGPHETWTYARFADTVDRIARRLVENYGVIPGNRVLLRGPNTPMLAACWMAVVKAGAIAVPTMPLLRSGELAQIIDKVAVRLALCDAGFLAEMEVAAAGRELTIVSFNGEPGEGGTPKAGLEALLPATAPGFAAVDTAADDVALIIFTSGTTGVPKAAAHFHRDLLAVADLSPRSQLNATADDVFCGSPTLAFAYGIGGLLLFPLRVGASVVLLERTTAERLLTAMGRHRATLCFTVPTLYRAMTTLLEAEVVPVESLSGLRACVSAGEPLPASTFEAWYCASGLPILDSLGTTEMLNAVIAMPPGAIRPGATGKAVPGYEAMLVDDAFRPVPVGQIGRLAVRGPTGCLYIDDARQRQYVQHGWNLTGDAFHQDADGYFWYHARTDDMIVSAGYKISGLEVEDVLLRHEAVEECAVVAAPDPLRGTIPKAYVVIKRGVDAADDLARDLQDFVKDRIAPYKFPRDVAFIDALPRTETGKIQRYKLRALAQGEETRSITRITDPGPDRRHTEPGGEDGVSGG